MGRIWLFVCLFHGIPVVRGGRRLTKEGHYATRRQAKAVLFVRRKPTPPFAGCQGNLLFQGSRGLQTGRPVDHRPDSARHWNVRCECGLIYVRRFVLLHGVEYCRGAGPGRPGPEQGRPAEWGGGGGGTDCTNLSIFRIEYAAHSQTGCETT